MLSLSVIVCTHNPRDDYFARCVAGLEAQTLSRDRWELIVIDNASAPGRGPHEDVSWHPRARLVHEATLGLTPARLRGIREATGDILMFVDDDNVLDADFLETALRVAAEKPFLGAWSGQCRPEFETRPPEWTRRYWGNLVIREFDADVWSNLPRLADSMPCGAGLCVRRPAAERYVALHDGRARAFQLDRRGAALLSGGDNDLAACACDIGLGVGLISSLRLTHLISSDRVTQEYLARLAYGIHFSSTLLDSARGLASKPRGLAGTIADLLRIVRTRRPHRRILKAAYDGRNEAMRVLANL